MTGPGTGNGGLQTYHRRQVRLYRLILLAVIVGIIMVRQLGCPRKSPTTRPAGPAVTSNDDYYLYNDKVFTCVKVLDGDTIDVGHPDPKARKYQAYTRIRMWGIDTPEISHFGKPAMYYGYEATEFARKLMAGKKVRLELVAGDTRDKFGRLLAYVYLPDGRLYNSQAVREGYAYAETRFKHPRRDEFLREEAQARKELRGLWPGITPDQLPRWYRPDRLEEFWASRGIQPPPASAPARHLRSRRPRSVRSE
jgi:endonuclease YncB( thermonuclease family)